ncbi:LacI family DNA-binding transcriptional regulator [Microbacterium immunditiarum]|uniref:LacI family transcriptional regulator n=1 Tax=Microbacterium immunditiarum TaxID=337480 RepID=A0A7Y9GS31_9MICO|nr:LacI family DNA-binding transcriptional regulator [Microbacterium immunditiarum]NYE21598.1 LacI family transcriptional regulator [Microbacterium immunditiarum]
MVTMYDVAARAGLSIGTVSRFVNARGYVGPVSSEKIRRAIDELGFVPNTAARSLTTKRSGLIGFVTSDLANPFTAELVQGLQEEAILEGYCVVTASTGRDEQRTLQTLAALRGHQLDGLIMSPQESPAVDEYLRHAAHEGLPVVRVGAAREPMEADLVASDTYSGGRSAMSHLHDLGHRRIAYVGAHRQAESRRQAYLDAVESIGLPVESALVCEGEPNREGGVLAGARLLEMADPPTAVFAANDLIALGVLHAAYRRQLRVPDDLSVVGFDDSEVARHSVPPLTTVAQPKQELGRYAARLLLDRVTGRRDSEAVERLLSCELVVRDSTAPI